MKHSQGMDRTAERTIVFLSTSILICTGYYDRRIAIVSEKVNVYAVLVGRRALGRPKFYVEMENINFTSCAVYE
jgi:hypothetical protein